MPIQFNSALSSTGPFTAPSFTGSLFGTASHVKVTGSGVTVNWDGDLLQLTASGGGAAGNLQEVTTAGNFTTQSVIISASFAQGIRNTSTGIYSHAEGSSNITIGNATHAEGEYTTAIGHVSHTEGFFTTTIGIQSHAEGNATRAEGAYSHAEGYQSTAIGAGSHAEGTGSISIGLSSHAEGRSTSAIGQYSHAEGQGSISVGQYSHAEGGFTTAYGNYSHAEGLYSVTVDQGQTVVGQYNLPLSGSGAFVIGNGPSLGSRSNILFASGSQLQITGSLVVNLGNYASDVAAAAGGVPINGLYHNAGAVRLRIS